MGRAFVPHIITPDSALGGFNIQRSVRFNRTDNHYFTRTPSSASNRDTYTISCWVKKGEIGVNQAIFYAGTTVGSNHDNVDAFVFNSSDKLEFFGEIGQSVQYNITTTAQFRDPSAWYHVVLGVDTTQGTSSNRIKLYVNGVQQTALDSSNYMPQNQDRFVNATNLHVIGYTGGGRGLDGNMAEYHFIDGSQLDPSYFGYTEPQTGIWRPKKYTYGNYGTNGFYLDFRDSSSTAALGHDRSGNVNNWTPNSFSVSAGEGNDSSFDTPSTNFITLNPIRRQNENCTLDNANLKATGPSASYPGVTANMAITSGKWYYEFEMLNKAGSGHPLVGICQNDYTSGGPDRICYTAAGGYISATPTEPTDPDSFAVGDIIGVAIDLDDAAGKIRFYKNGTLQPVLAILNSVKSDLQISAVGGVYPYIQMYTNDVCTVNFGQRPFSYTPPSGHRKLTLNANNNSLDYDTPSIIDPKKHFDTLLYTTGASNGTFTHTGIGFQADLMWIKCRNANESNYFVDSVRGDQAVTDKFLRSNDEGAEGSTGLNGTTWTTINGGFKVTETSIDNSNGGGEIYYANRNYAVWCWKAGGSSNTFNIDDVGYATVSAAGLDSGSINPTGASVNTEAGFSIITYTGTGSAGTISHGLGKAPAWIITKRRNANQAWFVHHKDLSGGNYIRLNNTNQQGSDTNVYPTDMSTTNTFAVGADDGVNGNGSTYVSYCWAEIPGYSKFGRYTGNGSSNGAFVYCGFRPAWILIKNRNANGFNWVLQDNKRSPFNLCNDKLNPDANNSEQTDYDKLDITADGFKLRQNASGSNASGGTYIYMAFAEQPGGISPFQTSSNAR